MIPERVSKPGAMTSPGRNGVLAQFLHGSCSVSLQGRPDRCGKISLGPPSLSEGFLPSCCFSDELWRGLVLGRWYWPCSTDKMRHSTYSLTHDRKAKPAHGQIGRHGRTATGRGGAEVERLPLLETVHMALLRESHVRSSWLAYSATWGEWRRGVGSRRRPPFGLCGHLASLGSVQLDLTASDHEEWVHRPRDPGDGDQRYS